jgi:hypothetical protein
MPRHVRMPAQPGPQSNRLLADLVGELRSSKPFGQPIILEDRSPETNSIRVQVVWDRWEGCPPEVRSKLIQDAYKDVFGEETAEQITLCLGMTVPEAAAMGLLPYKVEPVRRKGELPADEQFRQAMLEAGASVLSDPHRPQLRFATLDDAEATQEYLERALPNSKWMLVQEVLVPGD